MSRAPLFACLVSFVAGLATADEFVVFRKESRYHGAGLRVGSVELDKQGRLLLHGTGGELYSASPDDVDWDMSRRYTVRMLERERQAEERSHRAEEAARAAVAVESGRKTMSVLEASERFGVDNPSFMVTGSRRAARSRGGGPKDEVAAGRADPRLQNLSEEMSSIQARIDKTKAALAAIEGDRSYDALATNQRESRGRAKRAQLERLQGELADVLASVQRVTQEIREEKEAARNGGRSR